MNTKVLKDLSAFSILASTTDNNSELKAAFEDFAVEKEKEIANKEKEIAEIKKEITAVNTLFETVNFKRNLMKKNKPKH